MTVAIVGGGVSGRAIKRAMTKRGGVVDMFSRSTGYDVLRDSAPPGLRDAEVIVEATGLFTTDTEAATEFFTRSTRTVVAIAKQSGARHILLSIVNCELPAVQGYGYFAAKSAQERVARAESENLTLIRSTQWFEFAEQILARLRLGPLAAVPQMTIQPVALDAVADVVAACAVGERPGSRHDVAGPEPMTLWEMTGQVRQGVVRIPLVLPGRTWHAFRAGAMIPSERVEHIGPGFADWLAERRLQNR